MQTVSFSILHKMIHSFILNMLIFLPLSRSDWTLEKKIQSEKKRVILFYFRARSSFLSSRFVRIIRSENSGRNVHIRHIHTHIPKTNMGWGWGSPRLEWGRILGSCCWPWRETESERKSILVLTKQPQLPDVLLSEWGYY